MLGPGLSTLPAASDNAQLNKATNRVNREQSKLLPQDRNEHL